MTQRPSVIASSTVGAEIISLSDPASMEKATGADAVLLVERSGVSLIPQMNAEIIRLEKAGREIVGMVLAE